MSALLQKDRPLCGVQVDDDQSYGPRLLEPNWEAWSHPCFRELQLEVDSMFSRNDRLTPPVWCSRKAIKSKKHYADSIQSKATATTVSNITRRVKDRS